MIHDELRKKMRKLHAEMGKAIRGKDEILHYLEIAIASGGSVLVEDVPGVGKTTLVRALSAALRAEFKRVQFTADLLPGDLLGGSVYNPVTGEMNFRKGPVFTNILLADEINRASPRTQSALLEAMSERQISLEGRTMVLPEPFWVLATQNPIEYQGTYPLPEAQLDRFSMCLSIGYPDERAEMELLFDRLHDDPIRKIDGVMDCQEMVEVQAAVKSVRLDESVARYLQQLVLVTRNDPRLRLGASPRALLAWSRAAKAKAWLEERDFVIPEDIKSLARFILPHRLVLDNASAFSGVKTMEIVTDILALVKVPR